MKKIIICVLFISCIAVFSNFAVVAENPNNVKIERVNVANSNFIDVSISTDFICGGFEGVLNFDTAGLIYHSAEITQSITARNDLSDAVKSADDGIRLVVLGASQTGTNGKFITLRFEGAGNTAFSLADAVFSDATGNRLSVNINEVMFGDANSDYLVNIKDLVRMKKHFAQISETNILNSDCDRNGLVETNDMVVLKKFLLDIITAF